MISSCGCLVTATKEEASEGLHGIHAVVWYAEGQTYDSQSRNWFVTLNILTLS